MTTSLKEIPEKGFYVHHKNDPSGEPHNYTYEVIGIGRNTEEKTYTVLYRPLYANDWMAPADYQSRPLEMFIQNVIVAGVERPRFIRITDPKLITELKLVKSEMYG